MIAANDAAPQTDRIRAILDDLTFQRRAMRRTTTEAGLLEANRLAIVYWQVAALPQDGRCQQETGLAPSRNLRRRSLLSSFAASCCVAAHCGSEEHGLCLGER